MESWDVMREKRNCHSCGSIIYYDGLCWKCKEKQKYEDCMSMSKSAIAVKIADIVKRIEELPDDRDYSSEVDAIVDFQMLLAYQDINTEKIAKAAYENKLYSPYSIYRNASPDVRDGLIAELLKPDCDEAGNIQACLAQIGDKMVQAVFIKLEESPLPWRENLYVNPSVYAEAGGWSFDESGNQTLVHETCYALNDNAKSSDKAVSIGEKRDEYCSVCGCQMMDILTLDGRDERLAFLGINGLLKIPICPWCCCFTDDNVIRYQLDGISTYTGNIAPCFKENKMRAEDIDKMTKNTYVLDGEPTNAFRSHGEFSVPTIGGMPNWIQDWIYLNCPDCGKKMTYIMSIPWDCIADGFEGTLYIEICIDCQVARVFHQQT